MKLRVDGKPAFAATGGAPFRKGQPCVVFVHGAGMYHIVWALQARYFAYHGNSVLAIDLPGHGASKGPALTSIEAMGAWLLRVLDAKGVDQAILVGHSMGALVALEAAAQAPKRVEKLALLGGAGEIPVSPAPARTRGFRRSQGLRSHGPVGPSSGRPDRRPSQSGPLDDGRKHSIARARCRGPLGSRSRSMCRLQERLQGGREGALPRIVGDRRPRRNDTTESRQGVGQEFQGRSDRDDPGFRPSHDYRAARCDARYSSQIYRLNH